MTSSPQFAPFLPGNVTVRPSRICLGTCDFGTAILREQAFELLDLFFENGGNFIDSAHIYASWLPEGEGASEKTVGSWVASRKVRDSVIIATKGGHPPLEDMSSGRCSRQELEKDLKESLQRLQIDCIDLFWLHRDDPGQPVEEILSALYGFQQQGLIRSYGASNWSHERLLQAQCAAMALGVPIFCASQPGWSLADFQLPPPESRLVFMKREDIDFHTRYCFPAVPYSSQAKGFFGGENVQWAEAGFPGQPPRAGDYDSPDNRGKLQHCRRIAQIKGCTPNQIALACLLAHPFPVHPIIGTGNREHLLEALGAEGITLSSDECELLRNSGSATF